MSFLYKKLLKPLLFLLDPELVHNLFTFTGELLGKSLVGKSITSKLFFYKNKKYLEQTVFKTKFTNPVGLAAGFDYEARLTQILPEVGFGFHSVGSVTYGSYEGNAKPRLGRLPKSKSLLVNKGLKSSGAANVIARLNSLKFKIPLGVSIAKTNSKNTNTDKTGVEDYIKSLKLWEESGLGNYYEINISCPNAFGGEPFTTPTKLRNLLNEIDKLKIKKTLLIKMPIELTNKQAKGLLDEIVKHKVDGVIFGNLAKNRNNPAIVKEELAKVGKGNFSGKPTWEKSNRLISYTYKNYHQKLVIVGCGGIFSAKDAYTKVKLGACLVQLITGMIFEGPQLIGEINKGLVELLKKDGYKNISEAVGVDHLV